MRRSYSGAGVGLCLFLVGCGGGGAPRPAKAAKAAPARLLTLQRNGVATATLDLLTVYRDGSATLDKRYGGAGRRIERFRITGARMAQIRRGLRRLPRHARRRTAAPGAPTFLLRYGGRTVLAASGALTARERPLFRALDGVISGEARGRRGASVRP